MTVRQWLILIALALSEIVSAAGAVAVMAGLHAWQAQFGNSAGIGWIISGYMLVSAIGCAVFGRLGDVYGRRLLLLIIIALFFIGSLVSMSTDTLLWLVVGRVIQGAAGAVLPLLLGLVRDRLPPSKTSLFVSTIIAMASLGAAFSLVAAGMITDRYGAPAIFGYQAVLAVIAFAAVFLFVERDEVLPRPPRLDWQGGLLFTIGVGGLLLGITWLGSEGMLATSAAIMLASAVLLAVWYMYEKRHPEPLMDVRFLSNPVALTANLLLFVLSIGAMQNMQVLAPMLQQAPQTGVGFGLSATHMSFVKFPALAAGMLGSALAAWMIAQRGTRFAIVSGCVLVAISCLIPILVKDMLWATVAAIALLNVGVTGAYAALPITVMAVCPPERTSEATGLLAVFRSSGQAVGAQVLAVLLSMWSVTAPDGHRFPSALAYDASLGTIGLLALIAAVGGLWLRRGIGSRRVAAIVQA